MYSSIAFPDNAKVLNIVSKIIDIIPSQDLGNALTGTLDFTSEGSRKRIDLGYDDTKRILIIIGVVVTLEIILIKIVLIIMRNELV